jgi:C-5 cytosine-specific DNA methylase
MSQSKKRGDVVRVLDLFSGIGGFSLAARWAGMETVAFCEIDPFCQKVLKKNFPGVKIYDDIRTLTKEKLEKDGVIDDSRTVGLVCGGIPCQPFSLAGKQRGINDERYLWPEMYRIIRELRPPWVLIENVVGFVKLALTSSSMIWKTKVTKRGRLLYQLQPSVLRTGGTGSGLWPTPTASETTPRKNIELTKTGRRKCKNGKSHSLDLPTMVLLSAQKPEARGINPEWVEVLMGYPQGWTNIGGLQDETNNHLTGNHRG